MRFIRASIAGLMAAVLIAALELTALRSASDTWSGSTLLATCGVLGLAVVGAVCRRGGVRAWWLGFALFGWGYMAIAFWSPVDATKLPTFVFLEFVCKMGGIDVPTVPPPFGGGRGETELSFLKIGHCLWASLAAVFGGIAASGLFAISPIGASRSTRESREPFHSPRMWWLRPAVIGLLCVVLVGSVAVAGAGWGAGTWSGTTFLLTCGLLILAALGALVCQGRTREAWLGAALFGWGYLILAFGWHPYLWACPSIVTNQLLEEIRPLVPSSASGIPAVDDPDDPANARILKLLDETVPMHFLEPTQLEDVLKHVREATSHVDGKGVAIYVDPIGLQETEKSMTSTVRLNRDDLPLKIGLRYCLRQLDLNYRVKDGYLQISSADQELPIAADPFLTVGHCLLALISAGLGGVASPLVAGHRDAKSS